MTAGASARSAFRPRRGRCSSRARWWAAIGAYLLLHGSLAVALGFCALPFFSWGCLARRRYLWCCSVPRSRSQRASPVADRSTSLRVMCCSCWSGRRLFFEAVARGTIPGLQSLRIIKTPAVQYAAFMLVVLTAHLGVRDIFKTGTAVRASLSSRLVVGAYAVAVNRHLPLLKAYIITASLLACRLATMQ